ncbi:hypothetical protein K8B33_04040 [Alcanivorax sp. JB21]|uniref:hypothetical protein n=1 Tax=Alcanivorax limicola TaxID=2874102 RepID=UPI001CBFC4FA|nr:hypothetical protein [Alcanivorax limicola]MBZ2188252.1 hypothetical protein [Alcanivorax limicola]
MDKTTRIGRIRAGSLNGPWLNRQWLGIPLLMLSAGAVSAPSDLMGFCPDGTLVVNGTLHAGVDEQALRQDEQLLLDAFAAAGIRLPGDRISDDTLQAAVTGIAIKADGVETLQGKEGAGGTLTLSTHWRHDALASGNADNLRLSSFSVSFQNSALSSDDISDHAQLSLGDMPLSRWPQRLVGGPPTWGYADCYLERQCRNEAKSDSGRAALDLVTEQLADDRGLMLSDPVTGQFAVLHTGRLGERIRQMMVTCGLVVLD